jgi:CHAT domain-containing protein
MSAPPRPASDVWQRLSALGDDVLVADYHLGPGCVHLFVIRGRRVWGYRLPFPAADLPDLEDLQPSQTRSAEDLPIRRVPDAAPLVAPLAEHARGCSLIYLLPHGPLEHYSLHAMPAGGNGLINLAPVIYWPCLSMIAPPPRPAVPPRRVLVLGNMTGDLGGAEKEAVEVARMFGTRPYLQVEATLERLRGAAPQLDLLHIAGHGFFDPAQPLFSCIPFPDGILTVRRVFELHLKDCLVTLSGCVTGLGDDRPGEGFSSLVGAFFAGGARGLLVSLWSVNHAMTTTFMLGMYERAVRDGTGFPAALQGSYQDLRRRAEMRNPARALAYWAPFKAVGGW